MTSLQGILSNCGDFLPGTEPRVSNPVGNAPGPTYIPQPPEPSPVFTIPVTPIDPPIIPPSIPEIPGGVTPEHYIEDERPGASVPRLSDRPVRPGNLLLEFEIAAKEVGSTAPVPIPNLPNLELNPQVQTVPDSVYSPYYNFYDAKPAPNTVLVENTRYLNIFASLIAYEVEYFLNQQGTNLFWTEFNINNLTTEKVAISLNRNLFVAFNNIHNGLNTKIDSNVFYEMIRSHLIEGTLEEFDSSVYLNTYERQKGDILYTPPVPTQVFPASLAPTVFQEEAVNPNYESPSVSVETEDAFKRMRFLPEDMGTYVSVQQIDGNLYELPITNEGIPTDQLNV